MEKTTQSAQIVRFDNFEVDLETGELRKAGLKLKFSGQPFQVLAMLLERPGAVVTREELQKRLWPDTFVDIDHNLNSAINRIREALGDSAENPRFVETLPRRGYRFIAPVNGGRAASITLPSDQDSHGTEVAGETLLADRKETSTRRFFLYGIAGCTVLVSIALFGYRWTRPLQTPPGVVRYFQVTNDSQGKTSSYVHEVLSPLVSDGSRLYFMEGPLGNKKLVQVSTGGGETAVFPADFRIRRVLDVSPDRRELLVLSSDEPAQVETPLMLLPLPAGPPHRLGDLLVHDASWSPDGNRIVYANGSDLYLAKADGSEPRKLTTIPGTAWWPRWSPDGSVVRFTVLEKLGWRRLWEVSTDGSNLHRMFVGGDKQRQCCGNWTADGRYFVFNALFEGGTMSQISAIREEGRFSNKKTSEVIELTRGPMSMAAPLPGIDGKKQFAIAVQRRGQLVRYDAGSGSFVPFLSGISADGVDFSKDGQWVTYVVFPERTLWRSRVDGRERLQLTLPPMQVSIPRWSPDGRRIAFVGEVEGRPTKIYLVSADGGTPSQLILSERDEGDPTWSPDGNSIAFAPWFWLEKQTEIRLLDLRTRQFNTLPGSQGLHSARWSPDGRHMAALTADSSQTLMLFDFKTQKWGELYKSAAFPNWSRDGKYVYFDNPFTNEPALYRVRISDRKVEKITTLDPGALSWAIVGKWTGLAFDDSPLVLRDTSVEEIYALDWEAPQ